MAPVVTDRNLRQALTTSMYARSPGVQDLVTSSHPITAALRDRGAYRAYDGGPEIRVPLLIDQLGSQWFN